MKICKFGLLGGMLLSFTLGASHAQGILVAEHNGANNPTSEGFTYGISYGTAQVGPVTNDLDLNAWSMAISASGAGYTKQLTSLDGLDWRLSVTVRVVEDSLSVQPFYTSINTGQQRFTLNFGLDSNGDPSLVVAGFNLNQLVLSGAGSTYHNYELIYSAVAGTADLRVDGIELLSDLGAGLGFTSALYFGASYQNPGAMQANWNLVSLQIIPEPSAAAVFGLGALLLTTRRLRGRSGRP